MITATVVDRFRRFDYGAAVQAGIDHDRFGDLLRLLDWEIGRTQRTIGRSLLGPLTTLAEALQRVTDFRGGRGSLPSLATPGTVRSPGAPVPGSAGGVTPPPRVGVRP